MRRKLTLAAIILVLIALAIGWRVRVHYRSSSAGEPANSAAAGRDHAGRRDRAIAHPVPAAVSGRVTRASDNAGIAGAVVSLARAELGADFLPSDTPTQVVTTDANGAWTAPQVAPGDYVIAATALGFVPKAHARVAIAPAEQHGGVDIALDAGGTLVHGTVTDIGGGPIAGAHVTMNRDRGFELSAGAHFVALSGADGRYQITLADGAYEAIASHDDYTRTSHQLAVAGKPLTIDFVLTPGATIHGTVIARDSGEPVAGAMLGTSGGRGNRDDSPNAILADDDGKFTLHNLGSGAISITAFGRGYASSSPTVVEVGIGETVDGVRVVVDRAFTISGTVVNKAKPTEGLAGIRLGVFTMNGGPQVVAPEASAADGAFEILGVRPASYMLFALGEGAVPEIGKPVEIIDRDVTDVKVEMAAGVTISGRVDPAGAAHLDLQLAGEVGIANMFEMVKASMVHADTDATGAFVLQHVPAGKLVILASTTEGRGGKLPITVGDADQVGLLVPLEPRSSVSGRVIDSNGAAVAEVHVEAIPKSDHASIISNDMQPHGAVTAADGSFRLVGLEAGRVDLTVRDDQGDLAWSGGAKDHDVELKPGAELAGVVITVEARDGVIRGEVVGADSAPVADAWVTANRDDHGGDSPPVLTGTDGRFTIDHLRHTTYDLVADGPRGGSRATKTGVKPGDSVTLTLASLGTLAGHVTLGAAPVTVYDLQCTGPTDPISRRVTAADGSYSLEHLAPGPYECSASADGGAASGKIDVPTGAATLDLPLVPWASLTGVVISALTKLPVAGIIAVRANGADVDMEAFTQILGGTGPTSDATGRFIVQRVPAGTGTITLFAASNAPDPLGTHPYTVAAGQRLDLGAISIVPPRATDAGTYGLTTTADATGLAVTQVKPGGPADGAGIKVGDHLNAISGRTVTDLTAAIAQQLLSSGQVGVGDTVQLALDRGVIVTLVAVKW